VWLVLAHAGDSAARSLVARWGPSTLLLTPATLHRRSWRLEIAGSGAARATVEPADVEGVVTRLAAVSAAELPHVAAEDRAYVAAEFTAFLAAWLDACPCPVVNRPVAGSLNGPPWSAAHWAAAAAHEGLAVAAERHGAVPAVHVGAELSDAAPAVDVTVVGNRCIGPASPAVSARLCALARAVSTPLLSALLEGGEPDARVRALSAWPDVGDPEVADALAALLRGSPC
jgi:hypothetical protein